MPGGRVNLNVGGRASSAPADAPAGSDWVEHETHYRRAYREAPYYSSGRGWSDYAPAYRYGYDSFGRYHGRHFEEVESQLERDWAIGRAESRLAWAEARGAVRDIWRRIGQDKPGDHDLPGAHH